MGRGGARGRGVEGEAGQQESSPLLKLDSPDGQEEDGQAEPHSQGHPPADGLWAI